jgi:HPt (histidine-containing phosphotransfer) domain-containing protein
MPERDLATPSCADIDGSIHPLVDEDRLATLKEALGDAKLNELVLIAHRSINESAEELRANWRDNNPRKAGESAHRLVGVAANFGWPALATIAGCIEKSCKNSGDGKQYARQFEEILSASLANAPLEKI